MVKTDKQLLRDLYHIFANKTYQDLIDKYLDCTDKVGNNILMIACVKDVKWTQCACTDVIKFLLDPARAEVTEKFVNHKNIYGQTPLSLSIGWSDPSISKYILGSNKFDKNSLRDTDLCGDTPLMTAVKCSKASVVKHLLDLNFLTSDDLLVQDSKSCNVLFHACSHVEIIKHILDSDISTYQMMNSIYNHGSTPIITCAIVNCSNVIPMIESGKCIFPIETPKAPLYVSMHFIGAKSPSTLKYLLDNNYLNASHIAEKNVSGVTLLMDVCMSNPESVKIILESGKCTSQCLEMTNMDGSTPLIIACEYQPLAVEYLLNSDLITERAICAVNNKGDTCLSQACRYNETVVVQLLNSKKIPRSMIDNVKKLNWKKRKFTSKAIGLLENYRVM